MKLTQRHILLLLLLVCSSFSGFCDTSKVAKPDSVRSLIALPILFYGEETSWGFGASAGYYFGKMGRKTSSLQANAIVTLNKQFSGTFSPDIYTKSGDYYYSGRIKFSHYPNKFFGIGRSTADSLEEEYTSRDFSALLQRQRVLFGRLMFGLQYNIAYYDIADYKENGLISMGVCGSKAFLISGVGALVTYDTRDYRFWPSNGGLFKLSAIVYSDVFGSDYNFTSLSVDIRKFVSIYEGMVLAMQVYGDFRWNDVPFQLMPMLGGADVLRGYYNGRFRDNMMLTAQAEFRFGIYRWVKGVAFTSVGDVAPKINEFEPDNPKFSYGLGLRARVNDAKVHIRADIAFTNRRDPAIYLTAIEAF